MLALLASLLFQASVYACDFSPKVKQVYSLAGSVTLALRDLDLIKNPRLKGVSIFHPVDKKIFKGALLPGGVFLSHDTIKGLSGSVVFYDESRELSRILAKYKDIQAVEIKTRSQSPMTVVQKTKEIISSYLVGCDLNQLTSSLATKLEKLKKIIPRQKMILFFLGPIQYGRWPELLMVNDGVVKWMVDENLIKTYPSDLAYVNWSSKIMHDLPKETLKVGIKDSGSENESQFEKSPNQMNLTYPGALIPGSGQVEAMIYLFQHL